MRTIYIMLIVFVFAVLVIAGGIRVYYHWASVQYFGKIIEIKNGDFLIQTDEGVKKIILTTKGTIIRKGRYPITGKLQLGNYVIVVGAPNEKGFIEAKVIRVIEVPPL